MTNSRQKGKRAELLLSHRLTELGLPARRGVQYSGLAGNPDVVCDGLPNWHIECKMVEALNLYDAMIASYARR